MNTTDIELDMESLPWRGSWLAGTDYARASDRVWGDLLATMFEGQNVLHERYIDIERANGCVVVGPEHFGLLDDRAVQMRLKDLMERTIEELMEAANCLKNKPWKQSFVHTDVDHFQEEVADAFHFFLEFLMTAGISPELLFVLYWKKHAVNQFRQESKY